jgi:2-keto-3-deoxy-L-fuconate dehydrogenase
MAKRLQGRTAVVTAAGQGIGRAIAEVFVAEGARVFATDISPDLMRDLPKARKIKLDVRSTRAVEALATKTGPIDILVNAAGYVHHGTVLDCDEAAWDFSFDLNVKSMHRTIRAYLPGLLQRAVETGKSSSIVNIASGAGSVRGIPNRYVYGATKAAVIGLTKAVAADFIKKGIRANAICPGTIQSPSLDGRIRDAALAGGISEEAARQAFIDRQPMGRLGTAEEIAWLAVYLASEESSYTTGQIHLADGGFAL